MEDKPKFQMFDLVKCKYGVGNIIEIVNDGVYRLHSENLTFPQNLFWDNELTLVTDRVAVITDYEYRPIYGGKFIVIEGPGIRSECNVLLYTPESAAENLVRYHSRALGIYKVVDAKTLKQIYPVKEY